MPETGNRKKIVILGGGVGAMTAAFELTEPADWKDRYDITVYQLGWRLGGKGASGRNRDSHDRIEEHGLHIWFGFYDNGFDLIQRCYDALGRPAGAPLARWDDAFKPQSYVVLEEHLGDSWAHWPLSFPTNPQQPGLGPRPGGWDYVSRLLEMLHEHFERSPYARAPIAAAPGPGPERPPWFDRLLARIGADATALHAGSERHFLAHAVQHARLLPSEPGVHTAEDHQMLLWLLEQFLEWLLRTLEPDIKHDVARRLWIVLDLGITTVRGLLKDGILFHGFDSVDDENIKDWYAKHGATPLTLQSPLIWALYDMAFGFRNGDTRQPDMAAGTVLRATLRMLLFYRGAYMWKMQAGMGDTIFGPLYEVLECRGVKFEFFHRVTGLHPSDDGASVERISLRRQVHLKNGKYDPLYDVNGLPCWPSEPLYDQIKEGEDLKARRINLESYWTDWQDVEARSLSKDVDFDVVVLGISLGALPTVCSDLIAAQPAWRAMVDDVLTIRTQAFQLWLSPSLEGLGWRDPSPVMTTYVEPLDTWADMSHLIERETWPVGQAPGNIAYFCGPMEDSEQPPYFTDPDFPGRMADVAKANALDFVRQNIGHLWPKAVQDKTGGLKWELLVDPSGAQGRARFDSQFWHANIDPTERYVLSVHGSTQSRLRGYQSGFDNLYLAGDWTRTGLDCGCVEAAVMSGKQASRAICGFPKEVPGETDF
jgi:uncharacterized protein with NAD-binding domain and iron-sulfur cluster